MTVGAQLQEARKAKKFSVADVTAATKIQPWVVEAIEADRLQQAMSPIYVKGFINSYAKFLQLNPAEMLAQLLWAGSDPALESPAAEPPPAPAVSWNALLPKVQLPKVQLPSVQLPPMQLPRVRLPRLSMLALKRLGMAATVAPIVVGVVALHPMQRLAKVSWPKISLPALAKKTGTENKMEA